MRTKPTANSEEPQLEEFRKALGQATDGYSEGQLLRLKREIDILAELLLDFYFWKKRERGEELRSDPAVIDSNNESATLLRKGPPSESLSIS
jgi:hypothetical protein